MWPYFGQPRLVIGPFTIYAFTILVATAIFLGRWIILRRASRFDIETWVASRLIVVMVLAGFAGAHLAKLLALDAEGLWHDPRLLFQRGGIASFGGLAGGLLGGWLWSRKQRLSLAEFVRLLDLVAYVMPLALMLGRLGCTLAHDHRGLPSTGWFAVRFPGGPRYDLGLIEFLFLIVLAATFRWLDRRGRPTGFFFGSFCLIYGSFRVWLDTFHIQPLRFWDWGLLALMGLAVMTVSASRRRGLDAHYICETESRHRVPAARHGDEIADETL